MSNSEPDFRPLDEEERKQFAQRMPRRRRCSSCDLYWADPPSDMCPGCQAYEEHQR